MALKRVENINGVRFRRSLSIFYRGLRQSQREALSHMFFSMVGSFYKQAGKLVFAVTVDHDHGVATDIELVTKEHVVTVNNIYQLYGIAGVVAWAYRKRGLPVPTDPGHTSYLMAEKKLIEWEKAA